MGVEDALRKDLICFPDLASDRMKEGYVPTRESTAVENLTDRNLRLAIIYAVVLTKEHPPLLIVRYVLRQYRVLCQYVGALAHVAVACLSQSLYKQHRMEIPHVHIDSVCSKSRVSRLAT